MTAPDLAEAVRAGVAAAVAYLSDAGLDEDEQTDLEMAAAAAVRAAAPIIRSAIAADHVATIDVYEEIRKVAREAVQELLSDIPVDDVVVLRWRLADAESRLPAGGSR